MAKYKWVTFDAYSALLDIEGSMVPVLKKFFPHTQVDMLAVFRAWRIRQWDYILLSENLAKGFHSFRYLTSATLDYALAKFKLTLPEQEKQLLVNEWGNLKAWPEARKVLKKVQQSGYKIAILSNGDYDLLKPLCKSTTIAFDDIFCAEQARHYKPNPAIYSLPLQKYQLKTDELLHIAGSPFDMLGAKAAGIICGWSNRLGEVTLDKKYQPDYQWQSLSGILEIL